MENTTTEAAIITTPEELESYAITKVLLNDIVDSNRIFYRDNQSYFNILLDDNIRKWIIRVYMNRTKKYVLLNDGNRTKIEISTPMDITKLKNELENVLKQFL